METTGGTEVARNPKVTLVGDDKGGGGTDGVGLDGRGGTCV